MRDKMKQAEFEFMPLTTNDKAMPKENGIRNEFEYNKQKIITSRNNSISYMLGLYNRQVYLLKELKELRRC